MIPHSWTCSVSPMIRSWQHALDVNEEVCTESVILTPTRAITPLHWFSSTTRDILCIMAHTRALRAPNTCYADFSSRKLFARQIPAFRRSALTGLWQPGFFLTRQHFVATDLSDVPSHVCNGMCDNSTDLKPAGVTALEIDIQLRTHPVRCACTIFGCSVFVFLFF